MQTRLRKNSPAQALCKVPPRYLKPIPEPSSRQPTIAIVKGSIVTTLPRIAGKDNLSLQKLSEEIERVHRALECLPSSSEYELAQIRTQRKELSEELGGAIGDYLSVRFQNPTCLISYHPIYGFRKATSDSFKDNTPKPTPEEIKKFKEILSIRAKTDDEVSAYINTNPILQEFISDDLAS